MTLRLPRYLRKQPGHDKCSGCLFAIGYHRRHSGTLRWLDFDVSNFVRLAA